MSRAEAHRRINSQAKGGLLAKSRPPFASDCAPYQRLLARLED
jgi:hypothetical protein